MVRPNPFVRQLASWAAVLLVVLTGCRDDRQGADDVVIITWDAVNPRLFWGGDEGWDTIPNLDELFTESAVFAHTVTSRGLTGPALSSMLTGAYPRDSGIRFCNETPTMTTLPERFQQAGYKTFGYSANQCQFIDEGVEVRSCTSGREYEASSWRERDVTLVDDLLDRLDRLSSRKPLFLWLHLAEPHAPYEKVARWYKEFHPDVYEGDLLPASMDQLYDLILAGGPYDDEDRRHLEAVYASQLRSTDERVGQVLDKLRDLDRYDDAVVVTGFDHGDDLWEHREYFFHGCSFYSGVMDTVYSFRSPGLTDEGSVHDGYVSITDVAPTVVELAGTFEWDGFQGGRSLVDTISGGQEQDDPVFFERGLEAAGVIWHDHKYVISGDTNFGGCQPYQTYGGSYETEPVEMYDLLDDPDEQVNLTGQGLSQEGDLRSKLCDWVLESVWEGASEDESNRLVTACQEDER